MTGGPPDLDAAARRLVIVLHLIQAIAFALALRMGGCI
jgi:hypothetical protein